MPGICMQEPVVLVVVGSRGQPELWSWFARSERRRRRRRRRSGRRVVEVRSGSGDAAGSCLLLQGRRWKARVRYVTGVCPGCSTYSTDSTAPRRDASVTVPYSVPSEGVPRLLHGLHGSTEKRFRYSSTQRALRRYSPCRECFF
jgi:hypothetical protein